MHSTMWGGRDPGAQVLNGPELGFLTVQWTLVSPGSRVGLSDARGPLEVGPWERHFPFGFPSASPGQQRERIPEGETPTTALLPSDCKFLRRKSDLFSRRKNAYRCRNAA